MPPLYDVLNPWGPSDDFFLVLAMSAPSVLDLGCGTGTLLTAAAQRAFPAGSSASTPTARPWTSHGGAATSTGSRAPRRPFPSTGSSGWR